ncbi:MAG: glycosyltransferase family 4 protein [Paracoccaceae bacterium]
MAALRIAMLTTFYPPHSFGGDAVGVQRLARALVRRGHEVTVIHDADSYRTLGGQPSEALSSADDPTIVPLKSRWPLMSNLLTQQLGMPVVHGGRISRIIESGKFDIIWHNNASLVGGPGLLSLGRGLKVYEAHEHWLVCPMHVLWRYNRELCDRRDCLRCTLSFRRPPQLWRYTGMLARHAREVDLFIAKSEFSRGKHREFGFEPDMEVIPYFLPDLPASREVAAHDRPYFLFVGRLEKIKGLQDAFPAFEQDTGADLLILGDGEYAGELRRLAGGNPRIRFLGRKPVDELNAYYRGAIGLLVPSVCYETFGIILIESFRLGTPVLARRLGPFPEIVERSGGGVLFDDATELEEGMRRMRGDGKLRSRMAKSARRGFDAFWREDRVLAAYGAALARAARKSGNTGLAGRLEAGVFEDGGKEV